MKKLISCLAVVLTSSSLWAGATFSRAHNWVDQEVLTAADLNAEFNNILNNLDPAGMDDYSLTLSQMQTTVDPYPAAVESLATDLKGEIERLRYQILQLKKSIQTIDSTYWYQDTPGQGTFTIKTSSVGVNNTSPSYSLDVNGTQRVTDNAIFSSSVSIANTLVVSTITSTLPAVYITTNTVVAGTATINGDLVLNGNLLIGGSSSLSIVQAKNTSSQLLVYPTTSQIVFDSELIDRNSEFTANTFTAKKAGIYLIQASIKWEAQDGSTDFIFNIRKNGSNIVSWTLSGLIPDELLQNTFTYVVTLAVNDTIDFTGTSGAGTYDVLLETTYGPSTFYVQQLL